jgi:hypothetical protein
MTGCRRSPREPFLGSTVLIAGSEPAALAAKSATSTIPIVFVVGSDPNKLGIAESFNRPSANATGVHIFTTALEAKRLYPIEELDAWDKRNMVSCRASGRLPMTESDQG